MLKMAFRNIFRQKRRSILTALTMFGGFILAAVGIGFSDGTYNGIINMFTRSQLGHIQVHAQGFMSRPSLNKTINDYPQIEKIISETEGAEAWAPRVYSAGLASVGERTYAGQIIGIDPALEIRATHFDKKVVAGRVFSARASKEILLGTGLAQNLKASAGDDIVLVTQGADGSLANDKYRLIGTVETGEVAADRMTIYLHLDDARDLLVLDDKIHEIIIIARSLKKVAGLNAALGQKLAAFPVDVQPWQVFAKSFYNGMQAKKKGLNIILLIVFIVVAIGVLNTALMAVLERRREYGVLKAVGTRPRQIFSLILLEVHLLALGSILVGLGLSLPINCYLSQHEFPITGLFSKPVTFGGVQFRTMTSEVNLRSFLIPTITVIVSAFLVSILPAIKAARAEPAKSVRIF